MIYCFNSDHMLLSKHITYDHMAFNMMKFCFNDKRVSSFIVTEHNNNIEDIELLYFSVKKPNLIYYDSQFLFIKSKDFEKFFKLKFDSYKEFINYIKKYQEFTWAKNEINVESDKKYINFYGITNTLGMPNRGPIIQTQNKIYYFNRDIKRFKIGIENKYEFHQWSHILNPDCKKLNDKKVSVGPNIVMFGNRNDWWKHLNIVTDSLWMKEYFINNFGINEKQLSVIPIYVAEDFYEAEAMPQKNIIGIVGYPRHDDIKNMNSLITLCKRFPKMKFELMSSRSKSQFSNELQNIKNLKFYNVPHEDTVNIMKRWGMYLGLSKRERGPAVLQELKVLGIPTICPCHTGYKEFNPFIGLDIKPFEKHSSKDLDLYSDAINYVYTNHELCINKTQEDRIKFWNNEKSTKIVSKKWENFFRKCLGV